MRRPRIHLALAGVVLVVAAVLAPMPAGTTLPARLLVGWVVGSLAFALPVLRMAHRLDAAETAHLLEGSDGGRTETDVVVVLASVASLAAIAVMLVGDGGGRAFESTLAVLSVGSSWVAVHTVYTLRYARHYLVNEPGCIDFGPTEHPCLSDFAYLSFTLGMTYQVSDTGLRTPAVRRLVLRHTLLSYVFGAVVVAATINLVVGLAGTVSVG